MERRFANALYEDAMEEQRNDVNNWRTGPLYFIREAARLAEAHPRTIRRWLYGDELPGRLVRPVFGEKGRNEGDSVRVSFLQLAEIVVVSRFGSRKITLKRLLKAREFASEQFGIEYPFARLSLNTDGVHVLHQFEESEPGASLLTLDHYGQLTLPGDVSRTLGTFDFEDDLAARWFPAGKDVPIVVDPRFSAGVPTVPGRRVTVQAISKRWKAGLSMQFISRDLDLPVEKVEQVLRYADKVAA